MSNVLLLGPPGSGKGTIAQFLVENYKMNLLSTGHMLRQAITSKSELGLKAKDIMEQGQLVPDSIMLDLVADFMKNHNSSNGLIFDGFPRTIVQAEAMMDRKINVDLVIFLAIDDDTIVKRMSGRRVHPASGRVYHVENNPPKVSGVDDITQEPLVIRKDDTEEVVRDRLKVYQEQTSPLVAFYQSSKANFIEINASRSIKEVLANIEIVI